MIIDLPFVASGFGVGLLVGMTGVGGGSLMTPLLILLFGIHPATAVGTDLLFAATTKTGGSRRPRLQPQHHLARRRPAGRGQHAGDGADAADPVARADQFACGVRGDQQLSRRRTCCSPGSSLIFRRLLIERYSARVRRLAPSPRNVLTMLTGAILGVLVSISSVGAGALGVTALILLYPDQPTVRIVGSDIAHAVPLTLLAGFGHWLMGSVDVPLLGSLLLGSLPGSHARQLRRQPRAGRGAAPDLRDDALPGRRQAAVLRRFAPHPAPG